METTEGSEGLSPEARASLLSLPPSSAKFRIFYFMRSASCPFCRAHLVSLNKRLEQLRALDAEVCGLVPEPAEVAQALHEQIKTTFPIVSSPAMYSAFGFSRALLGAVQQSGTAVIEKGLKRLYLRRATMPFSALNERELFTLLQAQRK